MSFSDTKIGNIQLDTFLILTFSLFAIMVVLSMGCILLLDAIASYEGDNVPYANHMLVKKTVDTLLNKNVPFGYIRHSKSEVLFCELKDVVLDDDMLYCSNKGKIVPVTFLLAKDMNLKQPNWLNHVFVGIPLNSEVKHMLLKDYISIKHDIVFP